jgi:ferrochelatase
VAKQSSEKSNKKKRSEIENVKTAILLMNMGGPSSKEEVQPFLTRLFTDTDIMQLPFQSWVSLTQRWTRNEKRTFKEK